jgi:hypothetical protein
MNLKRTLLAMGFAMGAMVAMAPAPALADITVRFGPPPIRHEVVPMVTSGYVWVPGYWNFNGHRYVWVRGHRERARHGRRWVAPRWHEDRGRWRQERGRWDRY